MEASELVVTMTKDFFTVYFVQGITFLSVLYLIFSGQVKKLVGKFLTFTKLKAGKVEIETPSVEPAGSGLNERRSGDCKIPCSRCVGVAETIKNNSNDIKSLKEDIVKIAEHLDEVWVDGLELIFHTESIPLPRRLYAGLRFVNWKGNGPFKQEVVSKCIENPVIYDAILLSRPEFKILEVEEALRGNNINSSS